jgi:hypothetical protein
MCLISLLWFCFPSPAPAQQVPTSGIYQITAGQYLECCGFVGSLRRPLPYDDQAFIELTVDEQRNQAEMRILAQDTQTVFSIGGASERSFTFAFTNGTIVPGGIQFEFPSPPAGNGGAAFFYTVSNTVDGLLVNGQVELPCVGCADIPTHFGHTNVVATPITNGGLTVSIRISEVEICWNSFSNRIYQVEYRSVLTTNQWMSLGAPVTGNGSTNCLTDEVLVGQPRRFYRVLVLP